MSTTTIESSKRPSGLDRISTLLNARRSALFIETYEEHRFEQDLKQLAEEKDYELLSWSTTSGMFNVLTGEVLDKSVQDPERMIDYVTGYKSGNKGSGNAIFLIKDIHDMWNHFRVKRKIRDLLERPRGKDEAYRPIFFMSPQVSIPAELERLITMVQYDLPTRERVEEQLVGMESFLRSKGLPLPEGREREGIINGLVGMTLVEITNVLKETVTQRHRIDVNDIIKEKEQIIKKTGILEYVTDLGNMENVGGLDLLKEWFEDARFAFDFDAKEFKVDPARGVVLTGFPGAGKTLTAKSIAYQWNLPLLKMNINDIMDSKVGQSEKNMARALQLAETVSPCILFIDEMEKALGGTGSGESDGGTSLRVMNILLTWLSDKKSPVFVIGTCNDISGLRPELTRAGRFDEIFFVSVPALQERVDILEIHLKKRGYQVAMADLQQSGDPNFFTYDELTEIAEKMVDFTGSEIEQVVAETGRKAFAAFRKEQSEHHYMTKEMLLAGAEALVPLTRRNPALLQDLRNWAQASAKCASSEEFAIIHGDNKKDELVSTKSFGAGDLELN